MNISFIGAGNVAQQLAPALKQRGFSIQEVYNPSAAAGKHLAKKAGAAFVNDISRLKEADVLIIAVKDDAIRKVAQQLPHFKNCLVIHTSGATDMAVLKKKFRNCGVLWPVQTMKAKAKIELEQIPLVIEASNPASGKLLKRLANRLSRKVYVFDSKKRRILHLGAVWVNNFTNHLYFLSESLLRKHRLPYEILGPLILSTAENGTNHPGTSQTGPAKRNDRKTMQAHLKLLPDKNFRTLYKLISKSILAANRKK